MIKGKAYANCKSVNDRREGDFYATPKSLIWVAKGIIYQEFPLDQPILEPCSGKNSISDELIKMGYAVVINDLYNDGIDYLLFNQFIEYKYIITNPPFSLWDEFIFKAKSHVNKLLSIGRLNYLGTNNRFLSGIWNNLKSIYTFNRYVDYQTLPRDDGLFNVGAMATGWFLWDKDYSDAPTIHILDVQKYAQLGNFKSY